MGTFIVTGWQRTNPTRLSTDSWKNVHFPSNFIRVNSEFSFKYWNWVMEEAQSNIQSKDNLEMPEGMWIAVGIGSRISKNIGPQEIICWLNFYAWNATSAPLFSFNLFQTSYTKYSTSTIPSFPKHFTLLEHQLLV